MQENVMISVAETYMNARFGEIADALPNEILEKMSPVSVGICGGLIIGHVINRLVEAGIPEDQIRQILRP